MAKKYALPRDIQVDYNDELNTDALYDPEQKMIFLGKKFDALEKGQKKFVIYREFGKIYADIVVRQEDFTSVREDGIFGTHVEDEFTGLYKTKTFSDSVSNAFALFCSGNLSRKELNLRYPKAYNYLFNHVKEQDVVHLNKLVTCFAE